jgi:hypothetical protein
MQTLALVLRIELWIFLLGGAAIVLYQIATGTINTKGMLWDKGAEPGFSPARLQLMLTTFMVASYYGALVLIDAGESRAFPSIPNEMMLALGGSHLLYLGSKGMGLIRETLGLTNRNPKS